MSQHQFSQQTLNLNLPDMNLPDNFFSNFEEISKKYNDLDIKDDNIAAYENIIKNDSFNDINKIKFHNNNFNIKNNINKNKENKKNFENAELIFDSPRAFKLNGEKYRKSELNIEEEKNIFEEYLKSEYYINRNNKNYYQKDSDWGLFPNSEKIEKPNLKEILSKKPWDDDVEFIKSNIYNYKHFFPMQKEIINSVLMNKDIYAFFPNKEQKAICYQIPAIISSDKIFLIILSSEEIIKKEVTFMTDLGIKVLDLTLYNDNININIENNFFNKNSEENIKMLYCTPEKIYKNKNIFNLILELYEKGKLKKIVLDEVNYMSKWDKNFNNDYCNLKNIKKNFENCSLLIFTNNPSLIIRNNIINLLDMKKVLNFKLSYNKPNIYFEVKNKKKIKDINEDILKIIQKNINEIKSGIIYCDSEDNCKKLTEFLISSNNNIKCDCMHNGLFEKNQKEILEKWEKDEIDIIITNIDFTDNINKKDVRFIIHYNLPKNFDLFYNRIKILGLNAEPSLSILYYDKSEINFIKSKNLFNSEELRSLEKLIDFCEEEHECRRVLLLSYLNEEFNKENCYCMCDNCNKKSFLENIDVTKDCKDILAILFKYKDKKYYFEYNFDEFAELLYGNNINKESNFIKEEDFFGMMKNYSINNIKKIIRYLIIKEYVDEYYINNRISLKITNLGENLYNDNQNEIKILLPIGKTIIQKNRIINTNIKLPQENNYRRNYETNIYYRSKGSFKSEYALENIKDYGLCEPSEFDDLLEQLKNIRRDLLKKENIKRKKDADNGVFIPLELEDIISNEGLKELVRVLPTKDEDFEENYILKKEKNLELYKDDILPTILKFINIYNIDVDKRKENRQNNFSNKDYDEDNKEEFKKDGFNFENDTFNYKYNSLDEESNKTYNDKNCLFIGIKRRSCVEKTDKNNNKSASFIFNQLANKSKKNKKAKFL